MKYSLYVSIVKYLQDESIGITERWINVISNIKGISKEDLDKLSKREFNIMVEEVELQLSAIPDIKDPIKSFDFKNIKYIVDTSILDGNVNFARDYESLTKVYKDKPYELHKHITALTFYDSNISGEEIYSTKRYNKNVDIVGELPTEIVFGISKFFFYLFQVLNECSQLFSEAQGYLPKMTEILTLMEQQKFLTKDIQ